MSLRAIRTFDRKLTEQENRLKDRLDLVLSAGLPLPARPMITRGLSAALVDMADAIDTEAELFLARVQQEGHRLFERDLRDMAAAGVDVSGFEGNPYEIAVRAKGAWDRKFAPLWTQTVAQVEQQAQFAWRYDSDENDAKAWRRGWNLRVHSEQPVRRIGRSGRGVIWSVKHLVHANLLGIVVGLVNRERIESAARILDVG